MTIKLKPEQEQIIRADIESGRFRSPNEVLDYALATLKEKQHVHRTEKLRRNLAKFPMKSPLAGVELNLDRRKDYGRPIEL